MATQLPQHKRSLFLPYSISYSPTLPLSFSVVELHVLRIFGPLASLAAKECLLIGLSSHVVSAASRIMLTARVA